MLLFQKVTYIGWIATLFLALFWLPNRITAQQKYEGLLEKAKLHESLDQPDSALLFYQMLTQWSEWPDSLIKNKLHIAEQYIRLQQADKADAAISEADSLMLLRQTARLLKLKREHVKGKYLILKKDFESAHRTFENALQNNEPYSPDELLLIIRILNQNGIAYLLDSDLTNAFSFFKKAEKVCKINGIMGWDQADVWQNMGIVKVYQAAYDSAQFYFSKAMKLREESLNEDDPRLKSYFINYARFMLLINDIETSLQYSKRAEALFLEKSNRNEDLFGKLLLNMGNAYVLQNDFEKAHLYYRNALQAFERSGKDKAMIALARTNISFALMKSGAYAEAIASLKGIDQSELSAASLGKITRNRALAYKGLGDRTEADQQFRAYIHLMEMRFGKDHFEYGLACIDYADFLQSVGNNDEAVKWYGQSEKILRQKAPNNILLLVDLHRKQALSESRRGRFDAAAARFKLNEGLLFGKDSKPVDQSISRSLFEMRRADFYLSRAEFFLLRYKNGGSVSDLYAAFGDYRAAFNRNDNISIVLSDESRLRMNDMLRHYYQQAVETAYLLFNHTHDTAYARAAFEYSARSKAVLLMATLRQNEGLAAIIPENIARAERDISTEIQTYRKLVEEEQLKMQSDQQKIAYLERKQFQLTQKYDSIMQVIENEYPAYFALRFNPTAGNVDLLQQHLQPDELMLEYLQSDSALYSFAISKKHFQLSKTPHWLSIEKEVQTFRADFTRFKPDYNKDDFRKFVSSSSNLYQLLLAPFETIMGNKRLVIVPDGILGYLPFELLMKLESPEATADTSLSHSSLPFVIKTNPVSYMYASGMRLIGEMPARKRSNGFLAVAPSYENAGSYLFDSLQTGLQPLPFAREEAEVLADFMEGNLLQGTAANKARFKKMGENYQILHLAMHGLINDENPAYSRLVFQPASTIKNTVLETYELHALQLGADLVVLSACNTGDGRLQLGEGIMSLSRGFLFAGVPSIMMTGWEVNDRSSSDLNKQFYAYLKTGLPKDVALQKAKLDFLENANRLKSLPFFWAGYMIVGSNEPVELRNNGAQLPLATRLLMVSAGIFVLMAVLFWYRRKKKDLL